MSHVESVEDVMVQMVSNQGGLDELMDSLDALDTAGNPKPALRPQLNALYIARFINQAGSGLKVAFASFDFLANFWEKNDTKNGEEFK